MDVLLVLSNDPVAITSPDGSIISTGVWSSVKSEGTVRGSYFTVMVSPDFTSLSILKSVV